MTDIQRLYKDLIRYSYDNKYFMVTIVTANNSSFTTTIQYNSYQEYDNRRYFEINTETDTYFTIDTTAIKSITWDSIEEEYIIITDCYKMYVSIL